MKKLILLLGVFILSFLSLNAQTAYQKAMNQTIDKWEGLESNQELIQISNQFQRIAKKDTSQWQPLYYAILTRAIAGFNLTKEEAFKQVEKAEELYEELKTVKNDSETKILFGLMQTVKVSKDPIKYGQSLSPIIMQTYQSALAENPNNPRAIFHLAEYQMGAAKFWGKDPKDYCPAIKKSLDLFAKENKLERTNYEPRWGSQRANQVYKQTCLEEK